MARSLAQAGAQQPLSGLLLSANAADYLDAIENAGGTNLNEAEYHQRPIDRAHRRFLSVLETLARVRKPAPPALQVNIAKNQVNVT